MCSEFHGLTEWVAGVSFQWVEEPVRETQFRVLTATDAQNDVESTALVPINPQGYT